MSKAHICFACHLVRNCKGCCRTCKNDCNSRHDCEIHDRHMTVNQGWEWYKNVTAAIDPKGETAMESVPENLRRMVERKLRKEGMQLEFEFEKS